MSAAALDRIALFTVLNPYFNQTWGFIMLPFTLVLGWWAVRVLGRVAPSALIAGVTTQDGMIAVAPPSRKRRLLLSGSLGLGIVSVIAGLFVRDHEAQAGALLFGPPDREQRVEKIHLCCNCWDFVKARLRM